MSIDAASFWGASTQTAPTVKTHSKRTGASGLQISMEAVSETDVSVVIKDWQVVVEFPFANPLEVSDEERFWLGAANSSFSFWDNDEDAYYDNL